MMQRSGPGLTPEFRQEAPINPEALLTLSGHTSSVWALTVLPNGHLASGSCDNTIKVWDVPRSACVSTLSGHTDIVTALTVLPNGHLASGSYDKTIKVWDVPRSACVSTLSGHTDYVTALTVLPNGHLASGSHDNTIKVWDVARGACVLTLSGHTDYVTALTVLPNGHLASGSWDNRIKVWDVPRSACVATLRGHTSQVYALTVLPNGHLASGSNDKTIKVWDVLSSACVSTLSGHTSYVIALTVLPNGHLTSGSSDDRIKVWDVSRSACVSTLSGHTSSAIALTVLPNGHLASGSGDKMIKVWDVGLRPVLAPQAIETHSVVSVPSKTPAFVENDSTESKDVLKEIRDHVSNLTHKETSVRQLAVSALLSLALSADNQTKIQIAQTGAIDPLVSLLSDSDTVVRQNAAGALWYLTRSIENCMPISQAGAIPPLISLLSDSDTVVRQRAAVTLSNLAFYAENQIIIAQAGAIAPLVCLLTDSDTEVSKYAAGALVRLANDAKNRIAIEQEKQAQLRAAEQPQIVQDTQAAREETSVAVSEQNLPTLPIIQVSAAVEPSFVETAPKSAITTVSSEASERDLSAVEGLSLPQTAGTIAFGELKLGAELGRGGFGVVCKALWQGVTQVAVKQLLGQLTPDLLEEFQRETTVHARLRHPNIIALYGICVESMKYAMVIEFMASGSLYDVLKNPAELPWSLRLSLALDLASGLLYLHGQHIIHRDLKSLNILVDEHMRAKVSDFGLSKIKLTTSSMTKSGGGTPHWMAPELFDEAANSYASDIYATGIIFWEIAARKLPYGGKNPSQLMRFVEKGNRETIPEGTPTQFATLMQRCWEQRAEDRPFINDVAQAIHDIKRLEEGDVSEPSKLTASIKMATSLDSGYAQFSQKSPRDFLKEDTSSKEFKGVAPLLQTKGVFSTSKSETPSNSSSAVLSIASSEQKKGCCNLM